MSQPPDPIRPNDPSDEALDALLSQARWEQPRAGSIDRLRAHWLKLHSQHIRRLGSVLALAAAVTVVFIGIVVRLNRTATAPEPTAQLVPQIEHPPTDPEEQPAWRAPTPFERLLASGSARAPRQAVRGAEPSLAQQMQDLLRSADSRDQDRYLQLVLNESTRGEAIRVLRDMPDPPVETLLRQLGNPHVDRRFAAAFALGEVCEPRVVERLARMVSENRNRREALAALMQCHEPRAAEYLSLARSDPSLDAQLRAVQLELKQVF